MADIKISELGAANAVNATDLFPMTSSGVTVKATAQQIKKFVGVGNLADLNTTEKSSAVAAINEVNTKVSKTEVLISNVQTSLVASKAYGVDEKFIYNDVLYKVTTPIASGGIITIGSSGNAVIANKLTDIRFVSGEWNPGFTATNQEKVTTIDLSSYNFTSILTMQATICGLGYAQSHFAQIRYDSSKNSLILQAYNTDSTNYSYVRVKWLVMGI